MSKSKVPNRPSWDKEPRRLEKMLRLNGFTPRQGKGDHMIWTRETTVISLGLSNIENKLVWKIIRKYDLEWEEVFK